jgi:prepilin-type N-terminal cleavage/methylation domain-containing protein
MPAVRSTPARVAVRSAFTLLELLIVIGILATLMGLTVGAWMGMSGGNALVGGEHLVVDTLRQARHTARTSGGPVVLVFDKDARQIRGVSRIPLWQEGFDQLPADSLLINVGGRTGAALAPKAAWAGEWSDPVLGRPIDPVPRLNRLERTGRGDGWILSAAVRPPRPRAGQGRVLPVVSVTESGSTDMEQSAAGLLLVTYDHLVQVGKPGETINARSATWQVVGWRVDPAGGRTILTSHGVDSQVGITPTDTVADPAGPISGDRWVEIAVVWDGTTLSLMRNGRTLPSRSRSESATLPDPFTPALLVGRLDIAVAGQPDDLQVAEGMLIDDIALWRLGADQATALPRGIELADTVRVVARPDGSVGGTAAIVLRETAGGRSASIAIDGAGRVTSTVSIP